MPPAGQPRIQVLQVNSLLFFIVFIIVFIVVFTVLGYNFITNFRD